ncbi:hypothetical protein IQ37_09960 [Chryseobacterium piperi]|uniref:Uncharacterized protein n=1 Tax=Chryseobacterium piperi TaxID=558152 RepID=A0A086BID0_9FLAO|nr:hypothetical protein [Chryseobacterium piperi]ASW73006.1 hypothetical protein CJF12_01015 [Chryseobacterium piperi]KFF28694.1 hypothetical protein IQ37_09960 [Chryseobacterium piperi]
MRRRIHHRASRPARTPAPDPIPVIMETIETIEPIVEPDIVEEDLMPFVISNEDEIINYIKDKATKETLKSLAPLLEKLEEAVKQQQAYQAATPVSGNPVAMTYEEQLKRLQDTSAGKVKEKELKIAERMVKLQARFANIRK